MNMLKVVVFTGILHMAVLGGRAQVVSPVPAIRPDTAKTVRKDSLPGGLMKAMNPPVNAVKADTSIKTVNVNALAKAAGDKMKSAADKVSPAGIGKEASNMGKETLRSGKGLLDSITGITGISGGMGITGATGMAGGIKSMAGNPLQELGSKVKLFEGGKPFTINTINVEADYNYLRDTAGMGLGVFHDIQGVFGYSFDYAVGLASMPFNMSIRESNGINTMNYTPFQNFYKFNFDHEKYVESIRSKVMEKLSPDAIMASVTNRINSIRHNYEQGLQKEVEGLQTDFSKQYQSTLTLPAHVTDLSANDMGALHTQLLPGSELIKYQQESAKLQEMLKTRDPASLAKDTAYHQTLANVKRYEALEKVYGRITGWKQKFENNRLVKALKSHLPLTPAGFKSYLSKPANLEQVLDEQASLSGAQRLFYNIKKLDIGQNAPQSGELGLQNVVNTGINTEFQNKKVSMGIIYGKNSSVNSWQQAGLVSQVTNEFTQLTGFKLGTGSGSPVDQSVSLNFFTLGNQAALSNQTGGSSYLQAVPHKDAVITAHTAFQIGGIHNISVDLSKSFGSFGQSGLGDSLGSKQSTPGSVFNGAGKSNYAGVLGYNGQLFKTGVKLYLKKVGLGYNNPGNSLLRTGETQVGLGLDRKFLKRKLSTKYDADYRKQVFDPSGHYTYRAFTHKLQLGYKIGRNDKVGLTYQRSDYHTSFYGQASTGGVNMRLQLDGSYRFTVRGGRS